MDTGEVDKGVGFPGHREEGGWGHIWILSTLYTWGCQSTVSVDFVLGPGQSYQQPWIDVIRWRVEWSLGLWWWHGDQWSRMGVKCSGHWG